MEWEHGGEIHLNTPLFMACHAQLYTGSLLLAHPATLVDYIYITAAKPETMMDCLEAWFCHLGCLFDTLVISSFQSLFQPWISLNLGICPQTLSLVAKVYASDFSPQLPWSWGKGTISSEVHILMLSLEPGNISDSQQAYFWNKGKNSRVKNCYRGGWHQGHWKYLLIWGVHFCDEHISLDVCYTSVF